MLSVDAPAPARELSLLLAEGDLRRAGEWLVARYVRDVIGLCRSMVRERELAEDLAQDVFAQAFTNLRGYRAEAAPRTWLLSIARNRCIDHLRRTQREPWDDADESNEPDLFSDDAPLPAELLGRRGDVDAALGELGENERALVVLRFAHGLEYPELASVFGLREGTVRMRLSRALTKMRERLEQRELGEAAPAPRASLPEGAARPRAPAHVPPASAAPAPALAAPPRAGAPPPRGAPPPAPGAPPPTGAPPPPLAGAPARSAAKAGGFIGRVRDFFAGPTLETAAPPTAFAAALGASDAEPSERFVGKIQQLLGKL
ncbi:MAG: RNA polymerase sigma factor [Myxococcales bacterium]|nr:RNA polymerase sigma factor [Myxococcales bacterium]